MLTRFVKPGSEGGDGTTNATTGASAAFASLAAAEAALRGDYTSEAASTVTIHGHDFTNISLQIVCDMNSPRQDDGGNTASFLDANWTTDATHKVMVRAADGSTIGGQATNDSRNQGVFGAGYKVAGSGDSAFGIHCTELWFVFVDMEGTTSSVTTNRAGISLQGSSTTIGAIQAINCLGSSTAGTESHGIIYHNGTVLVNCIGKGTNGDGITEAASPNGSTRLYNCGGVGSDDDAIRTSSAEATPKNCWGFGAAGGEQDFHSNFAGIGNNNASEDNTADDNTGANPQVGLVATAGVDFEDYDNGDYRPAENGKLEGTGADLSADGDFPFAFDITGATRTQWDIGPFAFVGGGGGGTALPLMNAYYS